MKRVLKYLLILLGIAALVVFVMGYRLPEAHTATVARELQAPVDRVYNEIATPSAYPKWRSGIQRVDVIEAQPDSGLGPRFREHGLGDETTYEILEQIENKLFVTSIADEGLPYGGTWTFELEPTATGTLVRITEEGEVYNPFFRFVSKYVMGHTRGIETFLDDLQTRLAAPNAGA